MSKIIRYIKYLLLQKSWQHPYVIWLIVQPNLIITEMFYFIPIGFRFLSEKSLFEIMYSL